MLDDARQYTGLIGPNAVLQLVPAMESALGQQRAAQILRRSGIDSLPNGTDMIPEVDAASLHRQLRQDEPGRSRKILTDAGSRTADYILAHRIPEAAKALFRLFPQELAARRLAHAIGRHAWTFAGSGVFEIVDSWSFEIFENPLIVGESSDDCLCHWHASVFARLYSELLRRPVGCTEIACASRGRDGSCQFEVRPSTILIETVQNRDSCHTAAAR